MNSPLAALFLLVAALAPVAGTAATDAAVTFDAATDFSRLRTYALREGVIRSAKPEIDNRLFRQRMDDAIRARLNRKGLEEVPVSPALVVTYSFTDADYSQVERTPPTRIPDAPGQRGFIVPGSGPNPVLFTEGTLVIDVFDASGELLWRGTLHHRERSGPKLSASLPGYGRKLLSKFPPRRR